MTYPSPSDPATAFTRADGTTQAHSTDHGRVIDIWENVKHHGAKVDGSTDDSAAWSAAVTALSSGGTVYLPPGTSVYNSSSNLDIPNNVTFKGSAMFGSTLKFTGTGGLTFTNTTGARFQDIQLYSTGSGDLCTITSLSQSVFDHVSLVQDGAAKYIMVATDGTVVSNQWNYCKFDCSSSASVSPVSITSNGAANKNNWSNCWLAADNETSVHFFFIDNTNLSGYNYDNTFRDITAEQTRGGVIKMLSAFGTVIENVTVYDLGGATTNDLFYIGKHSGGTTSKLTTFRSSGRRGGSLGAGLYDLKLQSSGAGLTTVDTSHNSTLTGFSIDAGSNTGLIVIGDHSGITIDNGPASVISLNHGSGLLKAGGGAVLSTAALATDATDGFLYIPTCAGTPTGTPTTYTGTVPMVYDTTNHKFYIYDGGWKGGTNPGAFS